MKSDVTLLKEFCSFYGFYYYQTRESLDFQNILDEPFNGVYCFHAQGRINFETSEQGFINEKTYTGRLYFGVPSNLDGVIHEDKYDATVYNIDRLEIHKLLNSYFCSDYDLRINNGQPFYNLFNINYDGISYDYEVDLNDATDLTQQQKLDFIANGVI